VIRRRYLLVASGGGHLKELYESLPDDFDFSQATLLTYKTKTVSQDGGVVKFIVNPHRSLLAYALCFAQTFFYFLKYRPEFIISSGAGIAVPSIFLTKYFSAKLIFIETAASVNVPSRTGKFAYQHATVFVVQYEGLKQYFPNAKLGRLL